FGSIGIVYGTPEAGYATGFLIDNCHVLTVQHVFGSKQSAVGRRIVFAAGMHGSAKNWRTSWAVVVADGGVERRINEVAGAQIRVSDWALLRLHKCLGRRYGHVRLSRRLPAPAEPIGIAGYPQDRAVEGGATVDASCHVRTIQKLVLFNDCATLPGNSGSPLFRVVQEKGKPVLEVFAIVEAAHSKADMGHDVIERRDNYPLALWNVAAAICDNAPLASLPSLNCPDAHSDASHTVVVSVSGAGDGKQLAAAPPAEPLRL
ncbi:MAG TPA: trypsin-like peptidase domain-containing protein, partial [Chthoniobacterales bacterium]|nr:trypsin-like peptidase domain-containing protein [Chthoniobacterales bacterium]